MPMFPSSGLTPHHSRLCGSCHSSQGKVPSIYTGDFVDPSAKPLCKTHPQALDGCGRVAFLACLADSRAESHGKRGGDQQAADEILETPCAHGRVIVAA